MIKEAQREINALFRRSIRAGDYKPVAVMDASIASQARIILNKLQNKFQLLFDRAASEQTKTMVDRSLRNSAEDLKSSLKELSGGVSLKTDILTTTLRDVVTASIAESVSLFRTIPEKYFAQVQGSVMRSIVGNRGIVELQETLVKHDKGIRNWVVNTSLDQTRKVYNNLNAERSTALGITKYRWIHSGGSNAPRDLHIKKWPNGLNGGIFRYDDPPVIGVMYGSEVRGIPGQLPNCHCVQQPIFDLDD